ncbi:hypothetical protein KCMC57_up58360 [Kitasatospora sp. CMC57]|uniref:Transposase n=1 Tax=Kitasatospora sp. CMC57 TaxID=3231513 RepID=A0AB33K9K7_9ACTN
MPIKATVRHRDGRWAYERMRAPVGEAGPQGECGVGEESRPGVGAGQASSARHGDTPAVLVQEWNIQTKKYSR